MKTALAVGLFAACLIAIGCALGLAQSFQSSDAPTIRVTSGLVFLDVTVLDKKGRPVVKGLTRDDFLITEDNKPQRIFSFEAPETHVVDASAAADNPSGKAPLTIFVLDQLDSRFQTFAYIRYQVREYLAAQPARLRSPAELMVLGNQSLEMVQGYTRNKEDLLYALDHVGHPLPYKMNNSFSGERLGQCFEALEEIALQNAGVPGKKNIVWVGYGPPNLSLTALYEGKFEDELMQDVHSTTNMLVAARISLFVVYPGIASGRSMLTGLTAPMLADVDLGDNDPFAGDVNFGLFVNETGGKLFYNQNDIAKEITRSLEMGAEYYTLTYQPHNLDQNGRFRRIRVSLRDPQLRAISKAGYFGENALSNPQQQNRFRLAESVQSTIPLTALHVHLSHLVRHPDARTADVTVELQSKNVSLLPADDGKGSAKFTLAAASLKKDRSILAWKTEGVTLVAATPPPYNLPEVVSRFQLTMRLPRKTQSLRVVLESQDAGWIGAAELDRKAIDAAPTTPAPTP